MKKIRITSTTFALGLIIIFPIGIYGLTSQADQIPKLTSTNKYIIEDKWLGTEPIITEGEKPLLIIGDSWARRTAFGIDLKQKGEKQYTYQVLNYGIGNNSIMDPDYFVSWATNEPVMQDMKFEEYMIYWEQAIQKYKPEKIIIELGNSDQSLQVVKEKNYV